jgi:hypothetical protein
LPARRLTLPQPCAAQSERNPPKPHNTEKQESVTSARILTAVAGTFARSAAPCLLQVVEDPAAGSAVRRVVCICIFIFFREHFASNLRGEDHTTKEKQKNAV